jgi:hypothetical protein
MVQENTTFKPSLSLVLLDIIGTLLLGIGLAKKFVGLDFLPAGFAFDQTGWIRIIAGIVLMLPMLFLLFAHVRTHAEKKLTQ